MVLQAATGLDLLGGGYEVYLDILRSHAVQDKLIDQYNLKAHYRTGSLEGAEFTLFSRTGMFAAKEGMLWVTVQDEDPKMAADLANGYFTQLSQLNAHLGITAAGQLRRYYEGEMAKERDQLAQAEADLVKNQEKTGVIQPSVQATAALGAEEAIRAQLRGREIELQGVLQGATQQSPQVVRLNAEIAGLRSPAEWDPEQRRRRRGHTRRERTFAGARICPQGTRCKVPRSVDGGTHPSI